MNIYRQGDVLVVAVASIPQEAQQLAVEGHNKIILAFGEKTGHHHRIENVKVAEHESARIYSFGAERFLQAMETVALKHEEHSTVSIPPGIYQVVIQSQYSPSAMIRVTD